MSRDVDDARSGAVLPPRGELTLLVETPRGTLLRRIPNASPLAADQASGPAAEAATHAAAAVWGLPDFMYLPFTEHLGAKTREVGDGIVLVAGHGVVLQVKARDADRDDDDRDASWMAKQAVAAIKQGNGTVRRVQTAGITLTNLRGREVMVDGNDYDWTIAVILDHDDPPDGVVPDLSEAKHPAAVLLRRDWQFLFDQLKSTHAVVEYLRRVAGKPIEIGTEPERYYRLANADHPKAPEPIDQELLTPHHISTPMPSLPLQSAASEDRSAHILIRELLEDIAIAPITNNSDLLPGESLRLLVLGELDRLPVTARAMIGRFVGGAMEMVAGDTSGDIVWRQRSLRGNPGQPHLAYAACSQPHSREIADAFDSWLRLRHHDVVSVTGDADGLVSVGLLVTPTMRRDRAWDTTAIAVSGDMGFSEEELRFLRDLWPDEGS